jgi:hypothetical protein
MDSYLIFAIISLFVALGGLWKLQSARGRVIVSHITYVVAFILMWIWYPTHRWVCTL